MNDIKIFNNPEFGNIRVAGDADNPMFCLADVCEMLDISNHRDCKSRLNPKGVVITDTLTNGGIQPMTYINESNLYKVVFQSRKPDAEKFQDWVTSEILPSIRKHGAYLTNETIEKALTSPDFLIQIATELKSEQQKRLIAEETTRLQSEQLRLQAPKVQYVDEVLSSVNTYNANLIAKELGMSAETMNRRLYEMGVLYKQSGVWLLTYKYQNKGYTKTRTYSYTRDNGTQSSSILTVWTEKGRAFIHNIFKSF